MTVVLYAREQQQKMLHKSRVRTMHLRPGRVRSL